MSSTTYRLGIGEVSDDRAVKQYVRLLLLWSGEGDSLDSIYPYSERPELKDSYPTRRMQREIEERARSWTVEDDCLRAELEVIAARLEEVREWIEHFKAYEELPKLEQAQRWAADKLWVQDFCRRWGLVKGKEVPAWAEKIVIDTLDRTVRHGRWLGWNTPIHIVSNGGDFDPTKEPLKHAKRRFPRSRWPELSAAVQAYLESGYKHTPICYKPEVVIWAVRHQFGGEPWRTLAAETLLLNAATATLDERDRIDDKTKSIYQRAAELLRIAGLSRPRGRPRATR